MYLPELIIYLLEICVSQNLLRLVGGVGGAGGGRLIKCQGLNGGENWNAVCKLN